MDSDEIASLCESLSISSRDGPIQLLNDKLMVEAKQRLSLCIVGKILSSKRVNRDAFMRVIGKIWQVRKGMDIESIIGNTFTFHFKDAYDLERVLFGGPWSFDNALLAMEKPKGKETIESLRFNKADFWVQIHQVPILWKFMRVRVRVNIEKSLTCCLRVDILGDGVITTMIIRYKRLPNHCFKCGMVNHITPECTETEPIPIVNGKANFLFGLWLRASGAIRKLNFQNQKGLSFFPVNEGGFRRFDRGKGDRMQMPMNGAREEGVIYDAITSIAESSGSPKIDQMAGDMMEAGDKGVTEVELGSLPIVSGTQMQSEVIKELMSNGTEKGVINAEEVEEETCRPSMLGECEMASDLISTGQVYTPQCDGSDPKVQKVVGKLNLECLEPISPIGPTVNPVEEDSSSNFSKPSQHTIKEESGQDPGPIANRVRGVKFGGKRLINPRIENQGSVEKITEFQIGKRKIEEVASISNLGSKKSKRLGNSYDEEDSVSKCGSSVNRSNY
ncbi:hypothetical protein EZV62_015742 [Acer yangbiense]|uniref:DUF4283 domain-containing protein n=1 Tax=Acer yangbiense TaxID=1000413 RepID=A0A5C7HLP2_9ROSI|nr:hypothetical protein EZV62_015742 [Acer yangbiense]